MPRIGQYYRWLELPGTGNGYVRFKDGRVVCVNLKPELNPDAPKVILVGCGQLREKWARILCDQDRKVAFEVYVKKGVNKWMFEGNFVVNDWTEAKEEIKTNAIKSKRLDIFRVIKLAKINL